MSGALDSIDDEDDDDECFVDGAATVLLQKSMSGISRKTQLIVCVSRPRTNQDQADLFGIGRGAPADSYATRH